MRQRTRRNSANTPPERDAETPLRKWECPYKLFQARAYKPQGCMYCGDVGHKATECQKNADRKQILVKKKLCFNCATGSHRASECTRRHVNNATNATIPPCDQTSEQNSGKQTMMTASGSSEGVFPVLTVKVDGTTCRTLADSGAGTSYVSAKLVNLLDKKPSETNTKRVDMLMSSRQRRSGGGRASCLRRRINTRSRCSCVCSSSTAQRHYPAISGCQRSTRQTRAHDTST